LAIVLAIACPLRGSSAPVIALRDSPGRGAAVAFRWERACRASFARQGSRPGALQQQLAHQSRRIWLNGHLAVVSCSGFLLHNPRPAHTATAHAFFRLRWETTMVKPIPRLKLQGFNNLTKALSFNIYDICYAVTEEQRNRYIEYIDEAYNAERLTEILTEVADIIGANILNVARQDYDPQGASVTILISEQPVIDRADVGREMLKDAMRESDEPMEASVVAHLDKSHITVHTYPESHPFNGISTFRADIDVATCGVISPLKALNYLIDSFESDIVIMDYRVRGATRDVRGTKHYIDHKINSIQDFLSKPIKNRYEMFDVNVYQENIFHTKMHIKEFDLDTYLFEATKNELSFKDRGRIEAQVRREIGELFHGRNLD
jgi:S-adenosylmethionine decarboxylase